MKVKNETYRKMFSRYYKSFVIIVITTIPLIYSKQDDFTATDADDDFSDLYQQAPTLVLRTHNSLRSKFKLPLLKLKTKLNSLSKEWAEHLAKNGEFYHKPHNEYGENIYWENYLTGLHYPGQFVLEWYKEQKYFRKNMRFSELHRVSNFTQIIWRSTKYLGVAAVANDTNKEVYLVCMYDPPGNIVDEYLNNIDLNRVIPELETNLPRPEGLSLSDRLRVNLCLLVGLFIVSTTNIVQY